MGYEWELLKADCVYVDASRYIDGLMNDCGMSNSQAHSWTANLLKPFQGIQHVSIYLCPPMIGPFDEYEAVPDIDVQFTVEALRDAAFRGTDPYLEGLFFNKKEIITHSGNICRHKGVPVEAAPNPKCLKLLSSDEVVRPSHTPERESQPLRVIAVCLYERFVGEIANYEQAAQIMTSIATEQGYTSVFNAETVKRWKKNVNKPQPRKIA